MYWLSEKDVARIKVRFQEMAFNRRDFIFEQKNYKHKDEYRFQPNVNSESVKMVGKSGNWEGDCFKRLLKETKKCHRVIETQAEMESVMKQQCTFKPTITKHRRDTSLQEDKIWDSLYEHAKSFKDQKETKAKQGRVARAKEELAECTFRPSIHRKMNSCDSHSFISQSIDYVRDRPVDEFIKRMNKAREN